MVKSETTAHYAHCAAQSNSTAPVYHCDICGHHMTLYRVVFANGTTHFASRCNCGQRYWPQTAATAAYWTDAPLVPSSRSARKRQATEICQSLQRSEALDADYRSAIERDR